MKKTRKASPPRRTDGRVDGGAMASDDVPHGGVVVAVAEETRSTGESPQRIAVIETLLKAFESTKRSFFGSITAQKSIGCARPPRGIFSSRTPGRSFTYTAVLGDERTSCCGLGSWGKRNVCARTQKSRKRSLTRTRAGTRIYLRPKKESNFGFYSGYAGYERGSVWF